MTWRVLAAACPLLVAGCSGAPVPGGESRAPGTPTVTPAPVPDSTPTATRTVPPVGGPTVTPTGSGGLAPGVTAEGVVDAIALGAAHREVLAGRNLTVTRTVRVKYPNGTVVRLNETVRFSADRERLLAHSVAGDTSTERWSAEYDLRRTERAGSVTYAGSERRADRHALEAAYRRSFLSLLVAADRARVTASDRPDADYRLTATIDTLREAGSPFDLDPEPGTVSLYVRADGLVVGWDLAYTARTRRGTPVAVRTEVRHVAVDTTIVEPPDWYARGLAAAVGNETGRPATPTPTPAAS